MRRSHCLFLLVFLLIQPSFDAAPLLAQSVLSGQVQISPPGHGTPLASASAKELEQTADLMRARKSYLDALDYYQAAIAKTPAASASRLYNKAGIVELELQRYRQAGKDFNHAIKADRQSADAYNNLGVVDYLEKKNGKALKQYKKAIQLSGSSASFYSNLAAAYFSRKEFEAATVAYAKALQLDPDIFEHTSINGVAGRISSPQDQAHYDYVVAGLYAKSGNLTRSLEYLRRAMEEGYKGVKDVYKDPEFTALRKDARFTALMASKPPAIPE
ncbi:MAG: tetratricopeptide repeat protein [Terriglobales bacterium]